MKTILILLLVLAVALGAYWMFRFNSPPQREPLPSASPSPSVTAQNEEPVVLYKPLPESVISSPLKVRGKARGTWFFEGSFPVILTNWDGLIIAQEPAQALDDWMTEDWVEFEANLVFDDTVTVSSRAALILKKDNPSGLPQYDDAYEITLFLEE